MPPITVPVKKTPKISDLVHDPEPVSSLSQPAAAEQPSGKTASPTSQVDQDSTKLGGEGEVAALSDENANTEEPAVSNAVLEQSDEPEAVSTLEENAATQSISSSDEKFKEAWGTMFELLFREIATIYYPLKGMVPVIENNIIQVKVKNESMKENFESRTRLALEYLRNNYDPRIDDIHVEVDAQTETVNKVIYDTQDKMNDLKMENPDLPEFLKILNLSAKDM